MSQYYYLLIIIILVLYFVYTSTKESLENTYKAPSCGIANTKNNCHTCSDFIEAHIQAGLIYDKDQFSKCNN